MPRAIGPSARSRCSSERWQRSATRKRTLALTERFGTIETEALRDARLDLAFEASIALVGMQNERTAPAALRRAEELRARLNELADPPVYLLVMLAYYAARTNRADEAQELAERALECEPYPPPLNICIVLIVTLTIVECYDALQRLCEDLLAAARRRGAMRETIAILVCRASASCDRGALADAEADARWALERAEGVHRMHAISELIRVLTERDELEAAEDELAQLADPRASRSDEVVRFLLARGRLRGAQGRLQEALDDFLECGQRCEPLGRRAAERRAVARRGGAGPRGARRHPGGAPARGRAARAGAGVRAPADAGHLAARVRPGRGRRERP